jgi:hypothetical protein
MTKCKFKKYDDCHIEKTELSHDDMVLMFEAGEYENLFHGINITIKDFETTSKRLRKTSKRLRKTSKDFEITPKSLQSHPIVPKCEYCHMEFTRMNNKNQHIRQNRCLAIKNKQQIINCKNNNNQKINNNHNINNNQKFNNNHNSNNVNIQINGYGKEDTSYITNDILADIIKKPIAGIPKLIEMIHLNPDHPENNNIKLVNKNMSFLNYFNGSNWKTADKSKVLGNLLKSKTEMTDDFYNSLENEISLESYEKYSTAIKYVMNNFGFKDSSLNNTKSSKSYVKIYKKAEKDLFSMILSYKEYVKDLCNEL